MAKRLFDVSVSAVLLVLLAPLMAVVALAIVLESRGGPLFVQGRTGLGGRRFRMFKFRSMAADAAQTGGHRTGAGDPRVTRVGRIIRKTSLDELPQLVNVLLGDMSLVGPRPDTPLQEADYTPGQWQERHRVRPGITGLSQATLRSWATPEERVRMDLEYVRTASLRQDLRILALTVRQLLGRGGY
jgi:lipopolysaccharide/colanic/teichoic acid biosynthesis glycosyltransferase